MIDIYVSIVIYFIYASHKYYPIFFLKIIISGEFDRPVHIIDHRWQHGLQGSSLKFFSIYLYCRNIEKNMK